MKLLEIQWVDSKVVQFVSAVGISGLTKVKRRHGAELLEISCPNVIREYVDNMRGVDVGDQIRAHGGGFAVKNHFKKWYKKANLAVNDFQTLQGYIGWNMMALEDNKMHTVGHSQFLAVYSEELLCYVDAEEHVTASYVNIYEEIKIGNQYNYRAMNRPLRNTAISVNNSSVGLSNTCVVIHNATNVMKEFGDRPKCIICRIENNWNKKIGVTVSRGDGPRSIGRIQQCSACSLIAHRCRVDVTNRKIGIIFDGIFKDKTCWEVAHHDMCKGLFRFYSKKVTDKATKKVRIVKLQRINEQHPVYLALQKANGVARKTKRRNDRSIV